VNFNDFDITIREIHLEYIFQVDAEAVFGRNRLTLSGSTLLGDIIPLLSVNSDHIVVESAHIGRTNTYMEGHILAPPKVAYDLCVAALENSFDESLGLSGQLVPKYNDYQGGNDDGYVEYFSTEDEDAFYFDFLDSLMSTLPLEITARFGKDKIHGRDFFAVGFQVKAPIPLGPGVIREASGIVTCNMVVERDKKHQDRFEFSNVSNMKEFITDMEINKTNETSFAAGLRGMLVVAEVIVVDNLYFGFTNGPIVEAGGDLYIALSLDAIFGDSVIIDDNKDRKDQELEGCVSIGDVVLRYHHPNRHFSCNLALVMDIVGIDVTGNLGFEATPSFFRIYVGYPDAITANFKIDAGIAAVKVKVEFGQEFKVGEEGVYAKVKQRFDADTKVDLGVIYVKVDAYVGGEGKLTFLPSPGLELEVCLGGTIVGGIRFFGTHDVIRLSLDAEGRMAIIPLKKVWHLDAQCTVGYGIDLGIVGSISGSETVHIDITL